MDVKGRAKDFLTAKTENQIKVIERVLFLKRVTSHINFLGQSSCAQDMCE